MISFISLESYAAVFYWVTLFFIATLSLLVVSHHKAVVDHAGIRNRFVLVWGNAYFALMIVLIGLRPISYAFGDMGNYYKHFLNYKSGAELGRGDMLFEGMMFLFANYLTASLFFFACALLYLVPVWSAARKMLHQYWPLAFFLVAAQFDFYGYAVNGLRQGIGSSLFLLAIVLRGPAAWALVACAVGFHQSLLIPAIAYALTQWIRQPKIYLIGWFICLAITSVYSGLGEMINKTGLGGDKFDKYMFLEDYYVQQFSSVGFRMDFVIYSLLPIAIGAYFIFLKGFRDPFYDRLLSIYLICNAVWLLVIRIPASNRFAYLSWFLMGFVIAYPFVKCKASRLQHVAFAGVLLAFYLFTFFSHL